MPIKLLVARQIYDHMAIPTVEVDLVTELGLFRIAAPSTDVKKSTEAVQLRDNNPKEHFGMGVTKAVKNINTIIAPELIRQGYEVTMQKEIDQFLISLDGTDNKGKLGANAILAVSLACCKAGAAKKGMPLYRHISELADVTNIILPVPHITIFNGGVLSSNTLPFQEYMVIPTGASTFLEAMLMGTAIFKHIKGVFNQKFGTTATYCGLNGALNAPIPSHRDAMALLSDTIKQLGFVGKVEIALNAAGSDFYKDSAYDLDFKNPQSNPQEYYSAEKLAEIFVDNMKDFPLVSVEDPFDTDDWASFSTLTARSPSLQVVANDLTQTNLRRVLLAVEKRAACSIALRLNQAGTVTEIFEVFKILKHNKINAVVIDRWGDTDDLFLADLVIGLSAGQARLGAPAHERIGKYNHILRIEEELGALGRYAGKNYKYSDKDK